MSAPRHGPFARERRKQRYRSLEQRCAARERLHLTLTPLKPVRLADEWRQRSDREQLHRSKDRPCDLPLRWIQHRSCERTARVGDADAAALQHVAHVRIELRRIVREISGRYAEQRLRDRGLAAVLIP